MVTSLLTGLRISADALDAVVSRWLSPSLPQGEVWTVHMWAGLVLFGGMAGYVTYLGVAALTDRVAWKRIRLLGMRAPARLKWLATNVLLHWVAFVLVTVLAVTGVALYAGFGGWVVSVHLGAAFAVLVYTVAHVLAHFAYGGWRQLLRIFRPASLVQVGGQRRRHPLLVTVLVAVPTAAALAGVDFATRDVLRIGGAFSPPVLDGLDTDPVWRTAQPVTIRTSQGANLGGAGESTVDVRAAHDATRVYFLFHWQDPSRTLARLPMIKQADGWHVMGKDAGRADVTDFYEDKFAVIFAANDGFGAAGATHLGPKPLDDRPSSLNERGLHFTTDGSIIDMWQWKASRGGLLGYMDDQYIGPPRDATADEAAKRARYQGGYWNDPGTTIYSYNFPFEGPGGYAGPVKPKRLPIDPAGKQKALGAFDPTNPEVNADETAAWWLTEAESQPYSEEADRKIPVGTIMPGVLIGGQYGGDRGDIRAAAHWKDGVWTLEVSRAMRTGSQYDVDFTRKTPIYMWVAVFDHTQTRHTRHVRPVAVRVQ